MGRFVATRKRIDTGLKPGDPCYRVMIVINPDDQPDTWAVRCLNVKTASDRQITFEGSPSLVFGISRQRFEPSMLGRIFFRTPIEALEAYRQARLEEIASCHRKIDDAANALAWTDSELAKLSKEPA